MVAETEAKVVLNKEPEDSIKPFLNKSMYQQKSLPSLSSVQGLIFEDAKRELRFPESVKTYKKMLYEPNLAAAVALFEMMISRVEWKIEAPRSAPKSEHKRANLLDTNLFLLDRPWEEYVNEFCNSLTYGFSVLEKVYKYHVVDGVRFAGWKTFKPIAHKSISNWYFDEVTGDFKGIKQDISGFRDRSSADNLDSTQDIGAHKLLLFRHNPKLDSPEGNSPLKACYLTWKYLSIVEEYVAIGVPKDLGGVPKVGVHHSILSEAKTDPSSWQALMIAEMEASAANLHNGDQASVTVPLGKDDQGNDLFSFDLLTSSSGSRYDTDVIAKRHANKMLMVFFADVLRLGSDSHGSFSLADAKTSMLAMAIEAHLKNYQRILNHNLIKQTYEVNKWKYNPRTSARFVFGDLEDKDLGELASSIQRVMAVGGVRPTSDIEDFNRKTFFNLPSMADAKPEILEIETDSKSSKGMEDGLGNGTGKSTAKGGDRSKSNKSNK